MQREKKSKARALTPEPFDTEAFRGKVSRNYGQSPHHTERKETEIEKETERHRHRGRDKDDDDDDDDDDETSDFLTVILSSFLCNTFIDLNQLFILIIFNFLCEIRFNHEKNEIGQLYCDFSSF